MDSREESRRQGSIFSLSFLDVFACALGALVLILLMLINQVSSTIDTSAIEARIEELREQQKAVSSVMLGQSAQLRAAESTRDTMEALQQKLAADQAELARLKQTTGGDMAEYQRVLAEVEAKRQAQAEARSRVLAQRDAPSTVAGPATGTGAVRQQPRMLVLLKDRVRDIATNTDFPVGSAAWKQLIEWFQTNRATYYPLLIVKPEAVESFYEVEQRFQQAGIPYGYEPYVPAWDALLGQEL